jgi:hypothetical protein
MSSPTFYSTLVCTVGDSARVTLLSDGEESEKSEASFGATDVGDDVDVDPAKQKFVEFVKSPEMQNTLKALTMLARAFQSDFSVNPSVFYNEKNGKLAGLPSNTRIDDDTLTSLMERELEKAEKHRASVDDEELAGEVDATTKPLRDIIKTRESASYTTMACDSLSKAFRDNVKKRFKYMPQNTANRTFAIMALGFVQCKLQEWQARWTRDQVDSKWNELNESSREETKQLLDEIKESLSWAEDARKEHEKKIHEHARSRVNSIHDKKRPQSSLPIALAYPLPPPLLRDASAAAAAESGHESTDAELVDLGKSEKRQRTSPPSESDDSMESDVEEDECAAATAAHEDEEQIVEREEKGDAVVYEAQLAVPLEKNARCMGCPRDVEQFKFLEKLQYASKTAGVWEYCKESFDARDALHICLTHHQDYCKMMEMAARRMLGITVEPEGPENANQEI